MEGLIRRRTSAPSHFTHWQRENARTREWRWMGGRVCHQDMKRNYAVLHVERASDSNQNQLK